LDNLVSKSEQFSTRVADNITSYEKLEEQYLGTTDSNKNNMSDIEREKMEKVSLDEVKNLQTSY